MTDSLLPRSESVGAETLRALLAANTRLARELPPAPGALLRCPVEVGPVAIDPQTYGAFVAALHVPSCFNVVRARGLPEVDDCLLLDIELAILFPMIDRLLGGAGEDEPPSRALTEIELALAARIVRVFLQCLESSWSGRGERVEGRGESEDGQERQADKATRKQGDCAANRGGGVSLSPRLLVSPSPLSPLPSPPLSLDLVEVVSNPRLLRSLPTDERVLVVGFRLDIGDKNTGPGPVSSQCAAGRSGKLDLSSFSASGMARLCIPCRAVERAAADAGGKDGTADGKRGTDPISAQHAPGRSGKLAPSPFSELSVSWATTEITAEQLAGLRPGDIIATETAADGPVVVLAPRRAEVPCQAAGLGRPSRGANHRGQRVGVGPACELVVIHKPIGTCRFLPPRGATENSPAIYRWGREKAPRVP